MIPSKKLDFLSCYNGSILLQALSGEGQSLSRIFYNNAIKLSIEQ